MELLRWRYIGYIGLRVKGFGIMEKRMETTSIIGVI